MQTNIKIKLIENPKLYNYLKQNSYLYKYLNRSSKNYQLVENYLKDKYKLRTTDKIETIVDNIDMVKSILGVISE